MITAAFLHPITFSYTRETTDVRLEKQKMYIEEEAKRVDRALIEAGEEGLTPQNMAKVNKLCDRLEAKIVAYELKHGL